MDDFNTLWDASTLWAEEQAQTIYENGKPLTAKSIEMAQRVGVRHPGKIRVMVVPSVPFPDDPMIRGIAEKAELRQDRTAGMAIEYGVYIRNDHIQNARLFYHELRHVAQYECFGSIRHFMYFYLKEVLHFKYGLGPLEVDAIEAGKLAER